MTEKKTTTAPAERPTQDQIIKAFTDEGFELVSFSNLPPATLEIRLNESGKARAAAVQGIVDKLGIKADHRLFHAVPANMVVVRTVVPPVKKPAKPEPETK